MSSRIKVGDEGRLAKDVEPLCCGNTLKAGTFLHVWKRPSKNRAYVWHDPYGGITGRHGHNVKASAIWFMPAEIVEEPTNGP